MLNRSRKWPAARTYREANEISSAISRPVEVWDLSKYWYVGKEGVTLDWILAKRRTRRGRWV